MGKPKVKHESYLYRFLREIIQNQEMRQKAVQSRWNNLRRQHFHDTKTLTRTKNMTNSEQLTVLKGMKDPNELRLVDRKNCTRYKSNNYAQVCSGLPETRVNLNIYRQRGWGKNPTPLKVDRILLFHWTCNSQ